MVVTLEWASAQQAHLFVNIFQNLLLNSNMEIYDDIPFLPSRLIEERESARSDRWKHGNQPSQGWTKYVGNIKYSLFYFFLFFFAFSFSFVDKNSYFVCVPHGTSCCKPILHFAFSFIIQNLIGGAHVNELLLFLCGKWWPESSKRRDIQTFTVNTKHFLWARI